MKKLLVCILVLTMAIAMVACNGTPVVSESPSAPASASASVKPSEAAPAGDYIGISMPNKSSERWIKDGETMKSILEERGYTVDLQFAEDDIPTQKAQIETMLNSPAGVRCYDPVTDEWIEWKPAPDQAAAWLRINDEGQATVDTAQASAWLAQIDASLRPERRIDVEAETAGIVQALQEKADILLWDSPPILAAADAVILAPLVDGVMLVAVRDQTYRKHLDQALRELAQVGARTLGVVYNKAPAASAHYYHSYYQKATQPAAAAKRSVAAKVDVANP
jgi:chorismate-pyruvate lyase